MYIRTFVTADARRDHLERKKDGTLAVIVKAPPAGNQANKRVIELIAREFSVDPKHVRVISGHHNRSKMISIDN
ncbi:MAG TPA: DUF167 domain-containing protein [Candidatus Paceibacterota bacterium]|nr:DUF167 domain-containing protein [Candidatus Paceibacterota bacterium]